LKRQISELKIYVNFNVAGKRNSALSATACCAYARRIIINGILPDCFLMKVLACKVITRSTQSGFKALADRTVL